jgi:hypothetical protein
MIAGIGAPCFAATPLFERIVWLARRNAMLLAAPILKGGAAVGKGLDDAADIGPSPKRLQWQSMGGRPSTAARPTCAPQWCRHRMG